ncbi:MAG: DUF1772 domain-containing protein [Syntrophobacteraceae bacterium]|jgi:hypothetical protein
MENIQHFAQLLTTLCSSVFAGAAVYVNLVEHPARMACGTILAATEFAPSYKRAAIMQASLAACGLIASVVAWLAGAPGWWLIGGILLGSVIPFTLFFIMPINKELLNPSLDKGIGQNKSTAVTMGAFACRTFCAQLDGAANLPVLSSQSIEHFNRSIIHQRWIKIQVTGMKFLRVEF